MKTIEPSPNYSIRVPDDTHEQYDGAVLSLWRDADPTALQLSSYFRESGLQVSAATRLAERIEKTSGVWHRSGFSTECGCDTAAAITDSGGYQWHHIYVVTPRLAVYATISHPSGQTASSWAVEAMRGIRFATQRA
jgi:hypothetical protein